MTKETAVRAIRMTETSVRWYFNWSEWSPTESEFRLAISRVQLDEKERLGKFVFRKDTRSSLVGRLMMRKFVNEYCQIPYEKISLVRDANNKPILSNVISPKFANFNVSHQGSFTVFAGDLRNVKLGIDVMKFEYTGGKSLSEFFRIMRRNFSRHEWSEILGDNMEKTEHEQISMFYRHWALKESYVKAIGTGIVVDLGKLDFHTKTTLSLNKFVNDSCLCINDKRQDWHFQETLLDTEHCVAVALQENDETKNSASVEFERLSFHQLVVNSVALYPEDDRYAKNYFAKAEKP